MDSEPLLDVPVASLVTRPRRCACGPASLTPAVLLYVVLAGLASILFGYENSVVASGVNDYMGALASKDSGNQGLLKGALALGATVACPFAGFLQDGLGRRITLIICCVVYLGVCAVTATAPAYPSGFPQMAAGRFLTGMVVGVFSSTVPMYIAELSPPAIRGALVTVNQVCICAGILLGYLSSYLLSPSWRFEFAAATPLAAVLVASFALITPFSPRWLMTKGREGEARAILMRLRRGETAAVEEELRQMREAADAAREASAGGASKYAALAQPHIRWAVAIGVTGAVMQQWVGVNAVNGFAPNIFKSTGSTDAQAHLQTVYIGVAKLVFVVVALALMDRAGRRPLLLVGCAGMALSSALLAASYQMKDANTLAVVALVLYMAFFEISLGPILWLLLSELYPASVKGVAMSIGSTVAWYVSCGKRCAATAAAAIGRHSRTPPPSLSHPHVDRLMTYAVNQTYLPMSQGLGNAGAFYFYAAVCVASFLWIYMFIFETKGRTLEDIQLLLKGEKVEGNATEK